MDVWGGVKSLVETLVGSLTTVLCSLQRGRGCHAPLSLIIKNYRDVLQGLITPDHELAAKSFTCQRYLLTEGSLDLDDAEEAATRRGSG